jgi:hypothetical protein
VAKRLKAALAAAALALAGGLAGVLTAQAPGQIGLPTVSVPTVSLPLPTTTQVPLPPPPPLPPAPPLPTVSVPTPPVPLPTPPAPAPPPAAPAPSSPGSGSSPTSGSPTSGSPPGSGASGSPSSTGSAGSSGSFGATSQDPRGPASRSRTPRVTGIRARRARVVGRKGAARITFTLSRPGRVVFVVRGPAPSCRVAGRFSVLGERGVNHVRFTGRVGRRELPVGTYRVTARTRGRAPSRPILVGVGNGRVTNGFACGAGAATNPFEEIFATYGGTADSGEPTASGVAGRSKTRTNGDSGVLPAVGKRLRTLPEALPELALPSAGSPSSILGIAALLVLLLSGLGLVLYVVRYARRPRAT